MSLPPRDHHISLDDAVALVQRHRAGAAIQAGAFAKDQLLEVLNQAACAGLRLYHGRDAAGLPTLVVVGMDKDGNDLTSGTLLEYNIPCPPFCGAANALNS
jgi:hypothetical protein